MPTLTLRSSLRSLAAAFAASALLAGAVPATGAAATTPELPDAASEIARPAIATHGLSDDFGGDGRKN